MLAHLPNALSVARLASVPVAIWLILRGDLAAAFWVVVAAGISDALDGFIAKRFNAGSELGAFLDPIADKALLVSVYIALAAEHHLPLWLTLLVVFRDLLIVGGAIVIHAITHKLRVEPLAVSKINTFLQIALVGAILGQPALHLDAPALVQALIVIVALTTFLSGVAYVVTWLRRLAQWEAER